MRSNYSISSKHKFEKIKNQIKAIIFCEFDIKLGPVLKYQHPDYFITKEIFESLSVYLIPKPELYGKLITITAFNHKILGYPVSITDSKKYERNRLIFNLCFVFSDFSSTTQYEPIIQKLAHYLIDLEREMGFVSNKDHKHRILPTLEKIRDHLNNQGVCTIEISLSTKIHLKLTKVQSEPGKVKNYHVPVVLSNEHFKNSNMGHWDLTTQQICHYINGFNHISKIALEADVDISLVKACVQNLIYYGLVTLIPIFLYSNVYVTTPKIRLLIENAQLQKECLRYVRKCDSQQDPSLRKVLQLYSNMCPGMTVKDLCHRFNPNSSGIDEQRLIRFGLMNQIIRRIQKFPILLDNSNVSYEDSFMKVYQRKDTKNLYSYFDGKHSYDQICSEQHKSYQEIEDKVEKNALIVVCWK